MYDSRGSEPSEYILRRIEEAGTKEGEVQPISGTGDLARVRTLDHHQAAANAVIAAGIKKHQYASDSVLQGYDEYIPDCPPGLTIKEERERVWVVYVHHSIPLFHLNILASHHVKLFSCFPVQYPLFRFLSEQS